MGTKQNDDATILTGILLPLDFDPDYAADDAVGDDFTEADPQPGAAVYSGTFASRFYPEVSGTPPAPLRLQMKVQDAGAPPSLLARLDTGAGYGGWFGADAATWRTGYQTVDTDTLETYDILPLTSSTALVAATVQVSSTIVLRVYQRDADGIYDAGTDVATINPVSVAGTHACCLLVAPDGAVHLYAHQQAPDGSGGSTYSLSLWRSEDGGATWDAQGRYIDGGASATRYNQLRGAVLGGTVRLFATTGTTTSRAVTELYSTDGGYTFDSIATQAAPTVVWDAIATATGLYVLAAEAVGGTPTFVIRRATTGTQSVYEGLPTTLDASTTAAAYTGGGSLCLRPGGGYLACYDSGTGLQSEQSLDLSTWGNTANLMLAGAGDIRPNQPVMRLVGGTIVVLHQGWDGTTATIGMLMEATYGGASYVTPSLPLAYGSQVVGRAVNTAWHPIDSLANYGWTRAATGTPGTSLSRSAGESDAAGAGEAVTHTYSLGGTAERSIILQTTLEVVSGTATILVEGNNDTGTITVTSSTISDGTNTDNHSGGYLDVLAVLDSAGNDVSVWWRYNTAAVPREWTLLGTTATGAGVLANDGARLSAGASTTVRWLRADLWWWVGFVHPLADGNASDGTDLRGIPLGGGVSTYMAGGLSVSPRGGTGARNGETWTMRSGGQYVKRNLLPSVQPSPRRGWRSGTAPADQILQFSLNAGNPQARGSELFAVALLGLDSVPTVVVKDAGTTLATLDLRIPWSVSATQGNALQALSTGTRTLGPWLREDELVGGCVEFVTSGDVLRIVGNTSGSLTYGTSQAERRAVVYLESDAPAAAQAVKLWPPKALLVRYGGAPTESLQLVLRGTDPIHADDYRGIGQVVAGRVEVMGRNWDRGTSVEVVPGDVIQTAPDGSRYLTQREPTRRRVEVAVVDSHLDVSQLRSATSSPDYVVVTTGGTTPAADRYAAPLSLEGIVRHIGRSPCVLVPYLPRASAGWVAYTTGGAAEWLYGRMTNAYRREQLGIGQFGVGDGYRVPVLSFEEEV